jgi:hypothetical protein
MREDGPFEPQFKGETGFMMMKGAMDVLHTIDRLRSEPAYDWGRSTIEDFDRQCESDGCSSGLFI